MFNYATGPVEMTATDRSAMLGGPVNSHTAAGQTAVTETLGALRRLLRVPADFDVVILPGSIRQALHAVVTALTGNGTQALAVDTGYWGGFIAGLLAARGADVERVASLGQVRKPRPEIVTAVQMETETGMMEPLEALAELRAAGALTVVDAACTVPLHALDYALTDVVVLGSHKCLAGPPGLGIVAIRRDIGTASSWPLQAFREDARARAADESLPAPLVTYPIEIVLGLRASVTAMLQEQDLIGRRAAAAKSLRAGLGGLGFNVVDEERASITVTRVDLPRELDADAFRRSLAKLGFFVIGNVGASSGGSVRIGTMSFPQSDPANIERLVEAFGIARASLLGADRLTGKGAAHG